MKSKRGSNWQFLVKWVLAQGVVGFAFYTVWMQYTLWAAPSYNPFLVVAVNVAISTSIAITQFVVMPNRWQPTFNRWVLGSFIAGALSYSVAMALSDIFGIVFWIIPFFLLTRLPFALIQSWALNERFKKAWLWGLGSMGAALIAAILSMILLPLYNPIVLATINTIQALIMGGTLIFMSRNIKTEDNILSANEQEDARLTRLQLDEGEFDDEQDSRLIQQNKANNLG